MTLTLNTLRDFTLGNFRRVAWEGEAVALSPDALARMMKERRRFERLIEDPAVTIYGVTSGYGQHAKKRLTPEERQRLRDQIRESQGEWKGGPPKGGPR